YEPLLVEDLCFFEVLAHITHISGSVINASLTFSATDPDGAPIPNADMEYHIYELPGETLVASLIGGDNSYSTLAQGEYRVVAILNGDAATTTIYEPLEVKETCFDVLIGITPAICPGNGEF